MPCRKARIGLLSPLRNPRTSSTALPPDYGGIICSVQHAGDSYLLGLTLFFFSSSFLNASLGRCCPYLSLGAGLQQTAFVSISIFNTRRAACLWHPINELPVACRPRYCKIKSLLFYVLYEMFVKNPHLLLSCFFFFFCFSTL